MIIALFAKPLEDMATFEAVRDNEARTTEEEETFEALLAELEANEVLLAEEQARINAAYSGQKIIYITEPASLIGLVNEQAKDIAHGGTGGVTEIVPAGLYGRSLSEEFRALL